MKITDKMELDKIDSFSFGDGTHKSIQHQILSRLDSINLEINVIRLDINNIKEVVERMRNIINEKLTDVYGELKHQRENGSNAKYVTRQTIPIYRFI